MNGNVSLIPAIAPWKQLLLLFLLLFIGLIFTGLAQAVIAIPGLPMRSTLLAGSFAQALLAFIFPAFTVACLRGWKQGVREIEVCPAPSLVPFVSVALIYVLSIPAMNSLVTWNAGIHLPDSLADVEKVLRQWEDTAAALTESIFSGTSVADLIWAVLVVGVVTGFAEEAFFRGGLQRLMIKMNVNGHVAVWTAAFIFSAIHFQFFGFVPRLLLGAYFGYAYLWSRSLWVPAFAHAVNNSVAVVFAWLSANDLISFDPDTLGVASGFPLRALASAAAVIIMLIFHSHTFPHRDNSWHRTYAK